MAPTICTDKKTRRNSIRDLRLQRRNGNNSQSTVAANFLNSTSNSNNNNNGSSTALQHHQQQQQQQQNNYAVKSQLNAHLKQRMQTEAQQQQQQQQLSESLVTSTALDIQNKTACNATISSSKTSTNIALDSLSNSPIYQYSDDSMDLQQQPPTAELHREHSMLQHSINNNNTNCSSNKNFYNKVFSCSTLADKQQLLLADSCHNNNNDSLSLNKNYNNNNCFVQYENNYIMHNNNNNSTNHNNNNNNNNNNRQHNQSKTYSNLCEIKNTERLLAIAIKTINLVKRNQLLQRRLAQLQLETSQFIQSVLANPENKHFREKLQQKEQQKQQQQQQHQSQQSQQHVDKVA